jgi:hypothetical protein
MGFHFYFVLSYCFVSNLIIENKFFFIYIFVIIDCKLSIKLVFRSNDTKLLIALPL